MKISAVAAACLLLAASVRAGPGPGRRRQCRRWARSRSPRRPVRRRRSTSPARSTGSTARTCATAGSAINLSESLGGVPGCRCRTGRTTRRTCRSRSAASARVRPSACAACGSTSTAFRPRCPTARARSRNIDIGSADHVEVLRGPFSALYGNSSGGVVQDVHRDRRGRRRGCGFALAAAATAPRRAGVKASGSSGRSTTCSAPATSRPTASATTARPSAASSTASSDFTLDDGSRLTLVANSVALLNAQDPLGLTARPVRR